MNKDKNQEELTPKYRIETKQIIWVSIDETGLPKHQIQKFIEAGKIRHKLEGKQQLVLLEDVCTALNEASKRMLEALQPNTQLIELYREWRKSLDLPDDIDEATGFGYFLLYAHVGEFIDELADIDVIILVSYTQG